MPNPDTLLNEISGRDVFVVPSFPYVQLEVMSRGHRLILPAPLREPESKAPLAASGQQKSEDSRPVKKARLGNTRANTRVACYACRARKALVRILFTSD